jgi:anti-sigma regulatory factor (Ser/Thr protein kinase)
MGERLDHWLPHSADAPALARRLVEEHLTPLLGADRADDLLLMTSELVANAVRHSPPVSDEGHELLLDRSDGAIRVAVTDGGRHLDPNLLGFDSGDDDHFGMFIIDRSSDGWGFSLDGVKGVWFEVRR